VIGIATVTENAGTATAALGVEALTVTRLARLAKTLREVRLAVTRVGAGVEAVILIADTHVVIEETAIITAAEVGALALDRLLATTVPVGTTVVTAMTVATAAGEMMIGITGAAAPGIAPREMPLLLL
jgi:hypothetical protein